MIGIRYSWSYSIKSRLGNIICLGLILLVFAFCLYCSLYEYLILNNDSFTLENAQLNNVYIKDDCSFWPPSCKFVNADIYQMTDGLSFPDLYVTINNVTINENLWLRMSLYGDNIKVGNIARLEGSTVKVKQSIFNDIYMSGRNMDLMQTQAQNIVFKECYYGKHKTKCTLTLLDSTVLGNVIFEKGAGIIYTDKDSKIIGNITNAEIKILESIKNPTS